MTLDDIPLDDAKTFASSQADVPQGVSAGKQRNEGAASEFQPDRFDDITAIIALYRPGPLDLIPEFIQQKRGQYPLASNIAASEPILRTTYGVIVYQEQVMAIANTVGFSLSQTDILRRAMGKRNQKRCAPCIHSLWRGRRTRHGA